MSSSQNTIHQSTRVIDWLSDLSLFCKRKEVKGQGPGQLGHEGSLLEGQLMENKFSYATVLLQRDPVCSWEEATS